MTARGTGLVSIPEELNAEEAAPILCAGIATFNALKKCGAVQRPPVRLHLPSLPAHRQPDHG
ncbi:hypothetical protein [Dankookia rubra]|uniref:hypothetical protein n=1 Tax=Dankookia rubra TaxID=1442381 RepID=UPI001F4FCE76|nr:hypothetical protein [Dankookia rubra]